MFDTALAPYLIPTSPKIYPKINGYLQTLNQEVLYNLHRYSRLPGVENSGMMLLEHLLGLLPLKAMLGESDAFACYRNHVQPMLESMERVFDPIQQGEQSNSYFIAPQNHRTKTLIIPVRCDAIYSDLPLGMPWLNWSRMRPLRLASAPTRELSFHTYQDALLYRQDPPPFMVFSLNVGMLAMMYLSYYQTLADPNGFSPRDFLHRYVVYPALLEDNVQLWLRTQYRQCFDYDDVQEDHHKDYVWETANNGRIGAQYSPFIHDVYALKQQCRTGNLLPNGFLCSLMQLHGQSTQAYYKEFHRLNQVPDLQQYRWASYLLYEGWIDLFLQTSFLNKIWSERKFTLFYLKRDLQLFSNAHPWTNLTNKPLRDYIELSINSKLAAIDHFLTQTS